METFTKDSGQMIEQMGTESLQIPMELNTVANGKMTCNTVMERSPGIMEKLSTREISSRGKRMGKVGLNGTMEVFMRESLWMAPLMAMESITLQI